MLIITNFSEDLDAKMGQVSKKRKNEKIAGYYIMDKFEMNVQQYFDNKPSEVNIEFVFKIAIATLEALQVLHATQRTYNDMKPQNIMISKDANNEL